MDRKHLLRLLEDRIDEYRQNRPATAESDIRIFRAYCSGRTAAQIAMDIPCAEATVYRAIRRVKDLLTASPISSFMEMLSHHIADNPPNYGDWDAKSALEMLYVTYGEYNRIDSEEARAVHEALHQSMAELPPKTQDPILDHVADLCHFHERDGFTEGLKLGFRLAEELRS